MENNEGAGSDFSGWVRKKRGRAIQERRPLIRITKKVFLPSSDRSERGYGGRGYSPRDRYDRVYHDGYNEDLNGKYTANNNIGRHTGDRDRGHNRIRSRSRSPNRGNNGWSYPQSRSRSRSWSRDCSRSRSRSWSLDRYGGTRLARGHSPRPRGDASPNVHQPKTLPTNTKSITNTILAHLSSGRLKKVVSILFASPSAFPSFMYARLFQLCSSNLAIVEARKVESHLVTFTANPPTFLLNRAIEAYGKCGGLEDARELFDETPKRDGGSWNATIMAYSQGGCSEKALLLFSFKNKSGIFANKITFASVLGSCGAVLSLFLSRQVHGLVIKHGFCCNVILGSSLVDIYGKCWLMDDARRMFDEINHPNTISWNVIVRRYLEVGDKEEALFMFFKMVRADFGPLNFTFSTALIACSSILAHKEERQIHGVAIKIGFEEDEVVMNSLIDMYAKCGSLGDACRLFDPPCSRNVISWTSIVSRYAICGRIEEARKLFNDMPEGIIIIGLVL